MTSNRLMPTSITSVFGFGSPRLAPGRRSRIALAVAVFLGSVSALFAADAPSPAAAMMKLLKSGKVPEERLASLVKLVCDRGNADDLAYLFAQAAAPEGWNDRLRLETLAALRDASRNRKVIPSGDHAGLSGLLRSTNSELRLLATELSGEWKVADAVAPLKEVAMSSETSVVGRQAALEALGKIDPQEAGDVLQGLMATDRPVSIRAQAAAAMVSIDLKNAAGNAAQVFGSADPAAVPVSLLDAFLNVKNGSDALATELERRPPTADAAKILLRHMYSVGRTDAALSGVLSRIAGINQDPTPPSKEQIAALAVEAAEQGDAARGELVFRRGDLSCMKCHAVSKAGGQIGPDLSAVGSSSPVEYLVASILDPDQAIKEAYATKLVLMADGRIHQGIMADRTAQTLVLKDAAGKLTSLPLADIEEEVEGKSLMPKGLVNFMTHSELLDLVKFLSMLGKPGEYEVRSTQRMQRWQVLKDLPAALSGELPDPSTLADLMARTESWTSVYSLVNGDLPLADLAGAEPGRFIFVRGDFTVTAPGPISFSLNSAAGVDVWVDDRPVETSATIPLTPETGRHSVVFRVHPSARNGEPLRLELQRPAGSKAEFAVVDGQ